MKKMFLLPSSAWVFFYLILTLTLGLVFPLTTDEAYYLDWAKQGTWPALGFFDHPPMVSWIASFVRLFHHIWAARVIGWILGIGSFILVWRLCKKLLPEKKHRAILLLTTSLGGFASLLFVTPDTGLLFFWTLCVHELVFAVDRNPRRWLTAGASLGMGLLSKYTMVLMVPVFLWTYLKSKNPSQSFKWPLGGLLIAGFIFAPHVWWQAQNDWITFKFQFGHGFSIRQELQTNPSILPKARAPEEKFDLVEYALSYELSQAMLGSSSFDDLRKKPSRKETKLERSFRYIGDFFGGVLGLWGLYSIYALILWFRSCLKTPRSRREKEETRSLQLVNEEFLTTSNAEIAVFRQLLKTRKNIVRPQPTEFGWHAIYASAIFPLLFFGVLSPFTKIEANWPAMHMPSMAILICSMLPFKTQTLKTLSKMHGLLILLLMIMIQWPQMVPTLRNNRILLETKGFDSLGQYLASKYSHQVIAVESYQLKALLSYDSPLLQTLQWPGVTRPSEYSRRSDANKILEQQIAQQSSVVLIGTDAVPRVLPGYYPVYLEGLRVCPDGTIHVFNLAHPKVDCSKGLREWWLTEYRKMSVDTNKQ